MRKKDVILIVALLLVAGIAYGGMLLLRGGQALSGTVAVYVDSELYAQARLDTPDEIRVEQPGGEVNVIAIDETGVHMAYSSCNNQLCVHQGAVNAENWTRRSMGRSIVCLPNRVLVELTLDEGHPTMEDWDAPDI